MAVLFVDENHKLSRHPLSPLRAWVGTQLEFGIGRSRELTSDRVMGPFCEGESTEGPQSLPMSPGWQL